jgi:hypothetical protein
MWFIKEKLAREIEASGLTWSFLLDRLGLRFKAVADGETPADIYLARDILKVLGYDAVVQAIDWFKIDEQRRTAYAG